jgi:hypothetical protein
MRCNEPVILPISAVPPDLDKLMLPPWLLSAP